MHSTAHGSPPPSLLHTFSRISFEMLPTDRLASLSATPLPRSSDTQRSGPPLLNCYFDMNSGLTSRWDRDATGKSQYLTLCYLEGLSCRFGAVGDWLGGDMVSTSLRRCLERARVRSSLWTETDGPIAGEKRV